ncbi:unnamed protein product [Rotaria sp. Silwood2]|nr:unnamed protein product [Rotaria sp. Silwood2]CAF3303518.1 unnamed protein product [Rotaria sp. Silwood2]CAF4052681.1 unnamed protein product [Rotaria sp. Silwood2]CAF4092569.1 unnamed protein product [Rotaria sp. Silwood2]
MTDMNSSNDMPMNQHDEKLQKQMKYRAMFDYSVTQPIHEQKPEWSSKRLAKLQERRPIKVPIFMFVNPAHTMNCGNINNMTQFQPK